MSAEIVNDFIGAENPFPVATAEAVTPIEVTEVIDPNDIQVIRITNPFDPREFVRETLSWAPGNSLRDYFPAGTVDSVVSVNGKIIPGEEFETTYLDRGDNLVVCPIPQGGGGGGGGKQIMSMVAMLAVMVFAPYMAGLVAGQIGVTSALGMSMLKAGIAMAGSMLVQTIFAPSTPSNKGNQDSPTYGLDGAKNTSAEGVVVPVCYGRFRMAGNVVQIHVENDGDNQVLFMLINAGEGPVASITDVRLNDSPIENFKQAEMQIRLGGNEQEVIPWFANTLVPRPLGTKLITDWTYHTTVISVDKIRVDLVCPNGLYYQDQDDGGTDPWTVNIEIELRKVGTSTWTQMASDNIQIGSRAVEIKYDSTSGWVDQDGNYWKIENGQQVRYTPNHHWVYSDTQQPVSAADLAHIQANYAGGQYDHNGAPLPSLTSGTVPVYGLANQIKAEQRTAVRRSFTSQQLESGKYEIRVRRVEPDSVEAHIVDDVYLSEINEIILQPLSYPNSALLGIKVKMGDQITSMPRVTFLNGGKIISAYGKPVTQAPAEVWHEVASANPAWIVWDMLTNRRYGGGMNSNRLDFSAFKRWAAYCESEGLMFNGPVDSQMNVWDASQYVLRVGRAQLVNVGTRYTVVVERAQTPVMMFSVANMVKESYREVWLPMTDRANEVDVTFFDKEDDYKARTIKVYDPAALAAGQKQRTSAVTLYGVTEYDRAYKEGMFMMNLNRFILKTVTFSAPLEAIACTVGDLIYVQHDMPNWAQAGRFDAGSTATVVELDREVEMVAGKSYKLLTLHDAVPRYTGSITNIVGNTVFLSNFSGTNPVKRLSAGGRDKRIAETYSGSVVLDDTAGLSVGQSYTLFDTDVIHETGVVLQTGKRTTLQLQSALPAAPAQFSQWMFGEVEKVKSIFRIKSITGGSDHEREISAIQYDPRVYDYTRFASQHVPIENPAEAIISHVRFLQLTEETWVSGATILTEAVATWSAPISGFYLGADIYVKRGVALDARFTLLGEVRNRTSVEIPASRGEVITVKVVAFDLFGKRADYESAPEATYTVVGEITGIDVGDVTGADYIWNGRDCRISWRYNSTTHSYEFGSEPVGADAGALDPQFKDYEIRVFDAIDDDGNPATPDAPRRVEYVTGNTYTYTYEKNQADGLTRWLRFEIRMRDQFNNLGTPAALTAYNPPPRVTAFNVETSFESATLRFEHTPDPDYAAAMIFVARDPMIFDLYPDLMSEEMKDYLVYDGPDTSVQLTNLMFNADHYVRMACYDVFGKTELRPTDVLHFKTSVLDVNAIAKDLLDDSWLIPTLRERINLVDGPHTMAGSVAARLLDEAAARDAAILQETQERQTADESLAQQIDTLSASLNGNAAAIQTEQTARVTADEALAQQINVVAARVDDNTALIYDEATARATQDSALATQINVVSATVNNKNRTFLQTAAPTGTLATGDLWINPNDGNKVKRWSGTAWVDVGDARFDTLAAAISTETNARVNGDTANASQINTLFTTVNGNTTAIQTQALSIDGLKGQYTVKIDNNGYVAGFGLASYPVNGGITSEFIIRADKMAVVMPSYPTVYPFTIGAVNGVPRVVISSALIGDAAINTAKIGDLQVNTHNIAVGACAGAYAAYATVPPGGSALEASVVAVVPNNAVALDIRIIGDPQTYTDPVNGGTTTVHTELYINNVYQGVGSRLFVNPQAGVKTIKIRNTLGSSAGAAPLGLFVTVYKR